MEVLQTNNGHDIHWHFDHHDRWLRVLDLYAKSGHVARRGIRDLPRLTSSKLFAGSGLEPRWLQTPTNDNHENRQRILGQHRYSL